MALQVAALAAAVVAREAAQAIPAAVLAQADRAVATFLGVGVTRALAHQITAEPAAPVTRVRSRRLLRVLGCADSRCNPASGMLERSGPYLSDWATTFRWRMWGRTSSFVPAQRLLASANLER